MLDRSPPFHLIFGYRSVALSLCVFLTLIALLTQTFHNTDVLVLLLRVLNMLKTNFCANVQVDSLNHKRTHGNYIPDIKSIIIFVRRVERSRPVYSV